MSKYQHGKIYILQSNKTKKIYIGSTTSALCIRLTRHFYYYNQYLKELLTGDLVHTHNVSAFQLLEFDDVEIKLLYEFPCKSKKELEREEGKCILKYRETHKELCINICVPGRTSAEYRLSIKDKKNKHDNLMYHTKYKLDPEFQEKQRIYRKKYNKENKELIKEKKGKTVFCECGGSYDTRSMHTHKKSKKHLFFIEYGVKSENVKNHSIECDCGGSYLARYKNQNNYFFKRHSKTLQHQTFFS